MRSIGFALLFGAFLGAASGYSRSSWADTWPVSRHDAARTGSSSGSSPITTPLVSWRAPMGGRPAAHTTRFGLDKPEMIVAAVGGRFIAKNAITQQTIWKSEILGVGSIAGFADLDGDGREEVVARTETAVLVLDGATGIALFRSSEPAFRTPAGVRLVDLDGDGLVDLYIDECLSCAKPGSMAAGAFSFSSGFAAPKTLWMRPADASPAPAHTGTDGIFDLDGDGLPEIVLTSSAEVVVLRGKDGTLLAKLSVPNPKGKPFPQARPIAAELDGLPGKELLLVALEGQIGGEVGPCGVTAFRLDPKTGANAFLYRHVAPDYGDTMVDLADVVSDLDGDGMDEVIVSIRSAASGAYSTEILRGSAGTVVKTLADARLEGTADLDGQPGKELLLATADGLSVHHFDAQGMKLFAGPIPGVRAYSEADADLAARGALFRRLAVLPRPGYLPAFLVGAPSSKAPYAELGDTNAFRDIQALSLGPNGASVVGKHSLFPLEITSALRADFATRAYPQIAIGTSAGTVIVLDKQLHGTNGIVFWGGKATGSYLGGAFPPMSGAQAGPLIGADEAGPFVVFPGSPKGTIVADARFSSLLLPPIPRFIATEMGAPSIVSLGPLGVSLVGVEEHALVARRATDGVAHASVDLGPGTPQSTPMPLHVAGKANTRVAIDWRVEGVAIAQSAVDFGAKQLVWQGEPMPFGGFFGSGIGDIDGDGTDEWYSMNTSLNRRDANTGAVSTLPGNNMFYALPMVAPFRAGKGPELLLQAGASAPRLLDKNLVEAWSSTSPENVNGMAGARVSCGNGARVITPAVLSPFVRAYSGDTGVLLGERVLAGGKVFSSLEAAKAAQARPGVLSNITAIASLGQGGPALLVGSTDGHLYALGACDLSLRWSKMLGASVAEPIVGDTDQDGEDEIVVGVADGTIVALDTPRCPAPPWVSFAGASDKNAPLTTKPGEKASITFAEVEEANAYEYALVGPSDEALWSPVFRSAPGSTFEVDLQGVLAERPYRIAVRARGPKGASPETFSPTLSVHDTNAPTLSNAVISLQSGRLELSSTAKDDLALDRWSVEMGESDARVITDEQMLDGSEAAISISAAAPPSLYGKATTIAVRVLDSAGNAAEKTFEAQIDSEGHITALSETSSSAAPQLIEAGFFQCNAAPGAHERGVWLGIALSAALMGLRRRRAPRNS